MKIVSATILTLLLSFSGQGFVSAEGVFIDSKLNETKTIIDNSKEVSSSKDYLVEISMNKIVETESEEFGSAWVWPDFTMDLVESYTPFLFRTKASAQIDEVRVILNVDNRGELIGYKFINDVDKGLKERMGHVLRKLPKCLPVAGHSTYEATDFELIIKR